MCHLTHIGAVTLPYTVDTIVLQKCCGTTEKGLHLTLSVDDESGLAWLEDALVTHLRTTNQTFGLTWRRS